MKHVLDNKKLSNMNTDFELINNIKQCIPAFENYIANDKIENIEYPLDQEVLDIIFNKIISDKNADEFEMFRHIDEIKLLWAKLIKKSIITLRFYDKREPFIKNHDKYPIAYGIEELESYFKKYVEFESTLYGGARYYRDHVIHVFRVWLLGLRILLKKDNKYLDQILIDENCQLNGLEKIAVWTLIALTHDLGYPLEKAQGIINKTKDMMQSFVANPTISMDLSFSGVQNTMNDFVLRFMSSKMIPKVMDGNEEYKFVARLQPKYFFKFQKSLERNHHGILSSLVIYKLLRYFLESDYSTNEDYYFKEEDVRQFYIRREILRAISSHTCHDIYHMNYKNFSFLLILCDDAQEWGRKYITELYVNSPLKYTFSGIHFAFNKENSGGQEKEIATISIDESYCNVDKDETIKMIFSRFVDISRSYNEIFRDGQDTGSRNFEFIKNTIIDNGKNDESVKIHLVLKVSREKTTTLSAKLVAAESDTQDVERFANILSELFKKAPGENNSWFCNLADF